MLIRRGYFYIITLALVSVASETFATPAAVISFSVPSAQGVDMTNTFIINARLEGSASITAACKSLFT